VARTLVDLAGLARPAQLARAFHEAGIRHHTTPEQVEAVLARRPNAPGARELRRVMRGDEPVTLSRLEEGFRELLRSGRLDLPVTNRPAGGRYVDCRWPDKRVTVELDSYRYHRSRHAWERDRAREREARARGDEFRRYTYGDVFERRAATLADVRGLLESAYQRAKLVSSSSRRANAAISETTASTSASSTTSTDECM
jgi:very-short-patch-repair endonuclease